MSEIKLLCCPFCGETLRRNCLGNGEHDKNDCVLSGFEIPIKWFPLWNVRKPMQEIVERLEGRAEQEMDKSEKAAELGKAYERHTILHGGKGMAFEDAIEIVKEVGGMNG